MDSEIEFAKKNGFDSNGVSDLIGKREKKDGFWTNGGIEICQKNDGFDSNGVLDLREKKRWVLNERWIEIFQRKCWV